MWPTVIVVCVQEDEPIEHCVGKKPQRCDRNPCCRIATRTGNPQRFRKKIEKGSGEDSAGAEAEDEMQPVAQAKRERAAGERRTAGANCEDQDQ
jgi:hypothetical protein